MQGPPPPMMQQSMSSRGRMIVVIAVGIGLLLLMVGAVLGHMANQTYATPPDANTVAANTNLRTVWAPALWDLGMFFFVGGLVLAAMGLEDLDPFVRLFLLLLAFVALLMILANPATIFG